MRCQRIERSISELLDGRLSERRKIALDKHLSGCLSCRLYKGRLEMLHSESRNLEKPKISPQYREDFSFRLKKQLQSAGRTRRETESVAWRWTYGAAGAALAIGLILGFVIFQPRFPQAEEFSAFSPGGSLTEIYHEISTNAELEDLFNSLVLASIVEELDNLGWSEETFILENPIDQSRATERDLSQLESKIKQDI